MIPLQLQNKMNKTEASYENLLYLRKQSGDIIDYMFEAFKLKLADKTYYTPDFLVVLKTHFEIHEVKGFWRDDARVKIKVAAKMFPWFKFLAVSKMKGGGWEFEEINP